MSASVIFNPLSKFAFKKESTPVEEHKKH